MISHRTDMCLNAEWTVEALREFGVVRLKRCLPIWTQAHKNPISDIELDVPTVRVCLFLHGSLSFSKTTLEHCMELSP